ncbi:uncharacterized protein NECHADRAFT_53446 [Fusarium vanettenii 77-13-4]|uniref:Uncharacterized protein n=1 Tax=Fusarium vanettenii (strain ATCC MYA-4622 / CBS 123669 / FGSC 9596 / NRRL 45880 / 77-13-4) TaxID=660122 RepID=C7ZEA0_FUSV7|nr:uncharacterized protein NECHADRAFT_53446 [Fusarium vanettenii 77-13-4]EEU37729.1 hypothetical protein NECHADRAFT_53446 [Fusarium vanettenii 77-13-4]
MTETRYNGLHSLSTSTQHLTPSSTEPPAPGETTSLATPQNAGIIESTPVPPEKKPVGFKAPVAIKKLDGFISHLNRLIHTRDGHDSVILFAAYVAQLAAAILETSGNANLQKWANKVLTLLPKALASRAPSLPLGSKLFSIFSAAPRLQLRLAERLRALVDMLDDWSVMSRLWGLLTMWMLAKEFITTPNTDDKEPRVRKVKTAISATQITSLIGFFILENISWLSRRKVLSWSDKSQPKLILWCVRSWGVYVFAELGRLLFERLRKKSGETGQEDAESRTQWNKQFVENLAWAPLTVHWTTPGGLLPESVAALLASYAQFISVQGLWKETAETS